MGVGGLIGTNAGFVFRSYAVGEVDSDGDEHVGGLVGRNEREDGVTDTYWDIDSIGRTGSDNGTGLTTDEMTSENAAENMEGFDFTQTWKTTESYPVLGWQENRSTNDVEQDGEGLPGFTLLAVLLGLCIIAVSHRM